MTNSFLSIFAILPITLPIILRMPNLKLDNYKLQNACNRVIITMYERVACSLKFLREIPL